MAAVADNYVIRETRENDKPDLVKLLEKHFFPREYLNMVYYEKNKHKIDDIERKNIAADVKASYTLKVANHPSLVAVHNDSKEIVGISLMIVEKNPTFSKIMNKEGEICAGKSTPRRSKLLVEFSNYIIRPMINTFDVFAQFPSHQRALNLLFLCVNSEHSGRGLATKLLEESIKYAENNGCGSIYGFFTAPASQKAAEKCGFEKLKNIDTRRMCDSEGTRFYQDEKFYTVFIMAKKVLIAPESNTRGKVA